MSGHFPVGALVLVDGEREGRVRSAWPEGSTSFAFPHYRIDFTATGSTPMRALLTHSPQDANVAVAVNRVGVSAAPGQQSPAAPARGSTAPASRRARAPR